MENGRVYTAQLNIRFRSEEKTTLEAWANQQGKTLGELGRETLLKAVCVTPDELRRLAFIAFGNEVNRLTIVAAQAGDDISEEDARTTIEKQAKASAGRIVELWLARGAL